MILEWIKVIGGLIVGAGAVATWFKLKPENYKTKEEAKSIEVDTLIKSLKRLDEELANTVKTLAHVQTLLDASRKENSSLKIQISELSAKVDILTEKFEKADSIKCENIKCKKRIPPINKQEESK